MIKRIIQLIFALSLFSLTLCAKTDFSEKELNYLVQKKELKVCVSSNFMPFEDIDKNGKHIGFSSSYFEVFQKEIPVKFKTVKTNSQKESYTFLKNGACDLISTVENINNDFFLLTKPYIKTPLVIAIQSHIPYITDFKNLKDKQLGVSKTFHYNHNIETFFPTLNNSLEVNSVEEGLNQIAEGKLFGQIGTLAEIGYFFNKNFRGELKIAGKTDEVDLELSMAVRKDEAVLFDIMQKLIHNLDDSIHYDIVSKWTAIKYEQGINYALAFKIFALFLFLVLGAVIFLVILRNKNKKLKEIQKEIEYLNASLSTKVKEEVKKNREKDKHLFQQSRLALMGELLSMIAHQWRQPLALINGTILVMQLDFMKKKFDLDKEEEKIRLFNYLDNKFHEIEDYVKFLSNTITDFTTFYEPTKTKELVSINAPVEDALNIFSSMLKTKGTLLLIDYQTEKFLLLHKREITQVILNILQNSQDNFEKLKMVNPKIEIITKEKDGKVIISISDNGGGIDEKILPSIFDPYFSTKYSKNGTGLGLYMSKMIIEEHNDGKLTVLNNTQGVCFNINLKN